MVAIIQGRPSPRKTLTELDPVTFVIAASASGEKTTANLEANVSGSDVPRATRVKATAKSGSPTMQPHIEASSPTIIVANPIAISATQNVAQPAQISVGGMHANSTFQ